MNVCLEIKKTEIKLFLTKHRSKYFKKIQKKLQKI